jgi:hypothetical protein
LYRCSLAVLYSGFKAAVISYNDIVPYRSEAHSVLNVTKRKLMQVSVVNFHLVLKWKNVGKSVPVF